MIPGARCELGASRCVTDSLLTVGGMMKNARNSAVCDLRLGLALRDALLTSHLSGHGRRLTSCEAASAAFVAAAGCSAALALTSAFCAAALAGTFFPPAAAGVLPAAFGGVLREVSISDTVAGLTTAVRD